MVGRISTVLLFLASSILALVLTNALQLFDFILMFGAGTGLIFILRWFWWRINAWSEISAIFISGFISVLFNMEFFSAILFGENAFFPSYMKFPLVVLITTAGWLCVTFLTPPEKINILLSFYRKTTPGGPGWKKIVNGIEIEVKKWSVPNGILATIVGIIMIYTLLFSIGYLIYGDIKIGIVLMAVSVISSCCLYKLWDKIKT